MLSNGRTDTHLYRCSQITVISSGEFDHEQLTASIDRPHPSVNSGERNASSLGGMSGPENGLDNTIATFADALERIVVRREVELMGDDTVDGEFSPLEQFDYVVECM